MQPKMATTGETAEQYGHGAQVWLITESLDTKEAVNWNQVLVLCVGQEHQHQKLKPMQRGEQDEWWHLKGEMNVPSESTPETLWYL